MENYDYNWLLNHLEEQDYVKLGTEDAATGTDSIKQVEGIKACVADFLLKIEKVKNYYQDKIQDTEESLSEFIDQGLVTKIAISGQSKKL